MPEKNQIDWNNIYDDFDGWMNWEHKIFRCIQLYPNNTLIDFNWEKYYDLYDKYKDVLRECGFGYEQCSCFKKDNMVFKNGKN